VTVGKLPVANTYVKEKIVKEEQKYEQNASVRSFSTKTNNLHQILHLFSFTHLM
jgi:hypothetical protein